MTADFQTTDLIIRGVWAAGIIAAGFLCYYLANRLIILRVKRNNSTWNDLPGAQPGIPAILYFTTPNCIPCKTIQRPALKKLKDQLGDRLQVIEVDVEKQPTLASRWGVLSVPTTYIIGKNGEIQQVNHGATRAEKILDQLGKFDL